MAPTLAIARVVSTFDEGGKRATHNEKLMMSPVLAEMEVGLKVLPLAPTAMVCVAARTREAVRRAKVVRTSILQGKGGVMGEGEGVVGSRKGVRTWAIVYVFILSEPHNRPIAECRLHCATRFVLDPHVRGTRTPQTSHGMSFSGATTFTLA